MAADINQRIFVSHPDPWGTGVALTFVYLPMWDGPLERYTKHGWEAKFEDGTIATYEGECLIPFSDKPLTTLSFEMIDFSK